MRLVAEEQREQSRHWLTAWSVKGLLLPILFWAVMNVGLSFTLQPFRPEIQFAQNSGKPWGSTFFQFLGYGVFIVGTYWTALTLGWAIPKGIGSLEPEQHASFKSLSLTCIIGLSLPAVLVASIGGWPMVGFAVASVLGPIVGYMPRILRAKKAPPTYARAIARIKFGKYKEAEWEIIRELEKVEDDFEGWMMLAELYAKNFGDLREAEKTVLEICEHPRTTLSQLSVALHRLSEWHLNLANDPYAARRALQIICNRLPGTHLAHMAQLRINQLPATVEALHASRTPKPIPLSGYHGKFAKNSSNTDSELDHNPAVTAANACVEKLNQDPNDIAAREEFALLLIEQLGQVEQGLEQLMLLMTVPETSAAKRAYWLTLAAQCHFYRRDDTEMCRNLLQRLLHEFPDTPEAVKARGLLHKIQQNASKQGVNHTL